MDEKWRVRVENAVAELRSQTSTLRPVNTEALDTDFVILDCHINLDCK